LLRDEQALRNQMCQIGQRVWQKGMVAANDGNFSVKIGDNDVLCTPTGVSKGFMTPEMICKVDLQGNVLESDGIHRPSSEIKMHLRVYQRRPDVNAVVHAHPMYETSFAIMACKRQVLLDKLGVRTKTWTYKSGGSPCIPTRNE